VTLFLIIKSHSFLPSHAIYVRSILISVERIE
jgi:hypothetical protein